MTICDDVTHCDDDTTVLQSPTVSQPPVAIITDIREEIIRLLRENRTSNEVAKILNISRNSVVGIKHRYNLRHPEARIGRTKEKAGFKPGPAPKTKTRYVMWRGTPKVKLPENFSQNGYVPKGAKKIYQLKEGDCKFAVTDHGVPPTKHRFCGQPALENNSYCEHHHRLCREKASDRKAKSQANSTRGKVRLPAWFSYHY